MKPETAERLKAAGMVIPDDWTPTEAGFDHFNQKGALAVQVSLNSDLTLSFWHWMGACDDITIPPEVMTAMYLDAGVWATTLNEFDAACQMRNELDKSKMICTRLGHIEFELRADIRRLKDKCKSHHNKIARQSQELRELTERIRRQRDANREQKEALRKCKTM